MSICTDVLRDCIARLLCVHSAVCLREAVPITGKGFGGHDQPFCGRSTCLEKSFCIQHRPSEYWCSNTHILDLFEQGSAGIFCNREVDAFWITTFYLQKHRSIIFD